jgi:bidirectional [NiFe] hydrogenase diaphorase subunit
MSRVVTLKINDQDVSGRDDETILELANESGIFIPTLCHLEGLSDIGACRLCLVEIKGMAKLMPACVIRLQEGMEVYTESERLTKYRRMVIELLFVEGNHICSVCVANGHCELQNLAMLLGIDHINLRYRNPKREVDASHERFVIDHNRCILCTRCVRVCGEVEGAHTWDVMGRGIQSRVITDLNQPWGDSEFCTSCGKCVEVCPTGALFIKGKAVGEMTKHRDFLTTLAEMREIEK